MLPQPDVDSLLDIELCILVTLNILLEFAYQNENFPFLQNFITTECSFEFQVEKNMNLVKFVFEKRIFSQVLPHVLIPQQSVQTLKIFVIHFWKISLTLPNLALQAIYFLITITKSIKSLPLIVLLKNTTLIELNPIDSLLRSIFQHQRNQKCKILRNLFITRLYLWCLLKIVWMIYSIFCDYLCHLRFRDKGKR